MTDRLLLIMADETYRAGAFLAAAQELGISVTVGTSSPQVLSHANPDGFLALDFGDPAQSASTIEEFAQRTPLAAVLAAEDEGARLAAQAAEALGLRHHSAEGVRMALDKYETRQALTKAGFEQPWYRRLSLLEDPEGVAEGIKYPCVLKPINLAASRGVIRADDPAAFVAAFRRIHLMLRQSGEELASPWILVESYIPGDEIALEGLVSDGVLRQLAIFDKPDPLEGPFFEETIYVTPSRHPMELQHHLFETAARAAHALGLQDGPIHLEARVQDGNVWVLEVAPRSIGGLCGRSLRFSGGLSLEGLLIQHALGRAVEAIDREVRAAGVMMLPIPAAGVLRGVEGREAAERVPGIESLVISIPIGHPVVPLPEGNQYLGFLFARADIPSAVEAALRTAHSHLSFSIEAV